MNNAFHGLLNWLAQLRGKKISKRKDVWTETCETKTLVKLCFLMAAPRAYGNSWARDWVQATATPESLPVAPGRGSNLHIYNDSGCCTQVPNPLCHSRNSETKSQVKNEWKGVPIVGMEQYPRTVGWLQKEKKENGADAIFEVLMMENFPQINVRS